MKARGLLPILIISTLLTSTSVVVAQGNRCEAFLSAGEVATGTLAAGPFATDALSIQRHANEIKNAQQVSQTLMSEMTQQSDEIKAAVKGKVLELDVLCLGAGPQCASASLVLGGLPLKSAVVEKTDMVAKTFAEKNFSINSEETEELSMHEFPGGMGTLADLTSNKYADSSELATHLQIQQYTSNIPVLLGTEVTKQRVIGFGPARMIEVTTNQGFIIRAKKVILGLGLGAVGTKVKDVTYQTLFQANFEKNQQDPSRIHSIMATDTFLVAVKKAKEARTVIRMPKRLVLVGDGDGSRIVIEALASKQVRLPKGFHIVWIGNDYKTAADFVAGQRGFDRYLQVISEFYNKGMISGHPGHVKSWQRSAKGMIVTSADKETGQEYQAVGDMIVDATGYQNLVPTFLADLQARPELVDVVGALPEMKLEKTVLVRQAVSLEGAPLPVYATGASAGPLATKDELKGSPNRNPIAIFNTVPRTSAFVSFLFGVKPYESVRGARAARPNVKPAETIINEAKKKRSQRKNRPLTYNFAAPGLAVLKSA
jgi:hypothetical protein